MKLRGLYAITPESGDTATLVQKVGEALEGGISLLQYRRKASSSVSEARRLFELARRHKVPFIVNDDVDLALKIGADGVHLGRDDAHVSLAKKRIALVGASAYDDLERGRQAARAGADYVAFGSVFASPTKPAAVRAPLSLFANDLGVPLCAIGGITLENAPGLIQAGASLLAVISDLFDARDIRARARDYARLFS
jgi:thiamine-phosphate pyrophosphorylase